MKAYRRLLYTALLALLLIVPAPAQNWGAYMQEASGHLVKENYAAALVASQKALALIEKETGKKSLQYQAVLGMLAKSQAYLGQSDSARTNFEHLLTLIEGKGGGVAANLLYRGSLVHLADVYQGMGLYELAESHYEKTLGLIEQLAGKEDQEYLNVLVNVGNLYVQTNRPNQALETYERVLRVWATRFGKKDPVYVTTLNNLAHVYTDNFSQFARAEELYIEALKLSIDLSGKESLDYARSLQQFGQFYDFMGLRDRAETYYLQSLALSQRLSPDNLNLAFTQLTLANLYVSAQKYRQADSLFRIVEPVYEKMYGSASPKYSEVVRGLSVFYHSQQCYAEAEASIRQNLHILEMMGSRNTADYASCLAGLASLYGTMGRYPEADSLYRTVVQVLEKTVDKSHRNYVNALYCHAQILTQINPTAADSLFRQCQQLQIATSRRYSQFMSEAELAKTQAWLDNFFEFLTHFYLTRAGRFPGAAGLLLNTSLYLKANRLQNAQGLRKRTATRGDTALVGLLTRWQDQKRRLGLYEQQPDKARYVNLADERERANQLEKELLRRDQGFRQNQEEEATTWTTVQQRLKPGEAAIEFVHFRRYNGFDPTDSVQYAALLIRPGTPEPLLIPLAYERNLNALLTRYGTRRGNLYALRGSEVITQGKAPDGRALYRLIWQPLMAHLQGIKTIHFSPSGLLHRVAFAAIPLPDGSRLADRYDLYQRLSLRGLGQSPALSQPNWQLVAFGGIAYRGDSLAQQQTLASTKRTIVTNQPESVQAIAYRRGLSRGDSERPLAYLPGTRREVTAIRTTWTRPGRRVQVLTDYVASEEAFKALDGRAAPAVIHVATHGFVFPMPSVAAESTALAIETTSLRGAEDPLLRSGLLLAGAERCWRGGKPVKGLEDGLLTAYEIAQMDLSQTELVVLSACETGLGDIIGSEGVYGLQRAFKLAGAKRVLVSLWKVPDRETAEFMTVFYRAWQPGVAVGEAFGVAQRALRHRYPTDPHKWAAFTLVE